MTNPARQLHAAFVGWRDVVSAGNIALREAIDPTSQEGAAEVLRVGRLLARIEDSLADLERRGMRVDLYRRQMPDWVAAMVSYQAGWETQIVPDQVITNEVLDEIESLANFLDGKVYELGEDKETLRSIVVRAQQLLVDDTSLDPLLSTYIYRLLQLVGTALDDEEHGLTFDYGEALQRLYVAFRAAEGASPKRSTAWRELWTQIVAGVVSGGAIQGGIVIIQALNPGS